MLLWFVGIPAFIVAMLVILFTCEGD